MLLELAVLYCQLYFSLTGYLEYSEAPNLAPQVGVWEVRKTEGGTHGQVNRQVVLDPPCTWCNPGEMPINIIGNTSW